MSVFSKREESFVLGQDVLPDPFNNLFNGIYTDLNLLAVDFYGGSAPTSVAYGLKWRDTRSTPNVLRVYTDGDTDQWLWYGTWIGAEADRPTLPGTGAIWIDSANGYLIYVYTGSAWQATGVSGYVASSLFNENTILMATADNTPEALTVAEQTLVGRITEGNIAALSTAQVKTLLGYITSTLAETLDAHDNQILNIKTVSFTDEHDNGNSGTAITIDLSQGQHHKITLTGNCTITWSNPDVGVYTLKVIQDATGSRTLTLPSGKWVGGVEYTPTVDANAEDMLSIYYDGSAWYYSIAGLDYSTPS